MNEVYNPANRALRLCNENRRHYALTPFALGEISYDAYGAVTHLGTSIGYEAEMIRVADPVAAAVGSVYGFRFDRREPIRSSLPRIIFGNLLPHGIRRAILRVTRTGETERWKEITKGNSWFRQCIASTNAVRLPVNTGALLRRTDLGPLVIAMGHLMSRFSHKIVKP
ncbi:MAG: hypothetical protein IH591_01900 [Bacteroidales bacterium]|nr:hypothetical protein [Bacteroidales bacterium]